ncbi:type II secretion system minor pseudopilin GspK [Uliginosibacterium sp. H1]|uniref:type II secretion system minor pseudopilin GspK n=1 Tax=Uliginosibacterium sp. H1 TaxID=3114757 RepID=UPI002E1871DD|nr:type II secretion system minor pseudopilin GspK [Uliginosibacterium sp. H1]
MSSRCAERRSSCLQRGAAVVMAMLTTALIAGVATAVLADYGHAVRHLSGRHDQAQARWLALGGMDAARWALQEDQRVAATAKTDNMSEQWAIKVPPQPYEEGEVAGQIFDQSGRFNLNSLVSNGAVNAQQVEIFERLLVLLDIQASQARQLSAALVDWMDADDIPQGRDNTETSWYRSQPGRAVPPQSSLLAVEELRKVRGFEDPALLSRLQDHVSVLPSSALSININLATPEVIAAAIGLTNPNPQIAGLRSNLVHESVAEFVARLPTGTQYHTQNLDVRSEYFLVVGTGSWGEATVRMEALLQRRPGQRPEILWYRSL